MTPPSPHPPPPPRPQPTQTPQRRRPTPRPPPTPQPPDHRWGYSGDCRPTPMSTPPGAHKPEAAPPPLRQHYAVRANRYGNGA
ncbi:hypothetical protein DRB07_11160 [Actinomyces sp. Z3]|nr:hypothetical protein DRB07_11160 [Actinomyces sp. Z3]